MPHAINRRRFLAATGAAALAASFEERTLRAQTAEQAPAAATTAPAAGGALPSGKIRHLTVSRLICGGNLISGFAHSRDLIYLSPLLKSYFTDEKVCDTLELCEENGITTTILRVDEQTLRIIKKYWSERGGKIQWIAQVKPAEKDLETDIRRALDAGAVGAYVQGQVADTFVKAGKVDLIGKALDAIKKRGAVCGIGAHDLATTVACVKAGLDPDFYMKTFNAKNYWSATIAQRNDSVWEETPEETRRFMASVAKPWIAFKVLAAGAIDPKEGFAYAFRNGADFLCAGMFDFQVVEDVIIAKQALAQAERRERPWCA